jgi:hypothetical protein
VNQTDLCDFPTQFLPAFGGIVSRIYIDYDPPFVSPSKQGSSRTAEAFFKSFETSTRRQDLVLEPAECRLPGSPFMFFAKSLSECRVHLEMIGVIAIFIACCYLIDSLSQKLKRGMVRLSCRPRIFNLRCRSTENVESLIDLPHEKKAGIAGYLCTLKINADGSVKFRSYGPCLFVTNRAHADFTPSDAFVT